MFFFWNTVYLHTRFRCTAEIKLLPVSENGRSPYWNCTSGFDFDLCVVIGISFCIHPPNFVAIRQLVAELWRHIDFSRWRPAAILDLTWIILDHPRSAIVGLRLVLKFDLDRIYSFGDIPIFIFCRFGLKLPIHAHFGGFWGHIPPNDVTDRPNPQKTFPYAESRSLSHKAWKSVQQFDLGEFTRKKDMTGENRTVKKSHKVVIFRLHGEKPSLYRLEPKFAWWVASPDVSRMQSFKLKFLGVTLLQWVEFSIFHLIFAWALQQCSVTALPLIH